MFTPDGRHDLRLLTSTLVHMTSVLELPIRKNYLSGRVFPFPCPHVVSLSSALVQRLSHTLEEGSNLSDESLSLRRLTYSSGSPKNKRRPFRSSLLFALSSLTRSSWKQEGNFNSSGAAGSWHQTWRLRLLSPLRFKRQVYVLWPPSLLFASAEKLLNRVL